MYRTGVIAANSVWIAPPGTYQTACSGKIQDMVWARLRTRLRGWRLAGLAVLLVFWLAWLWQAGSAAGPDLFQDYPPPPTAAYPYPVLTSSATITTTSFPTNISPTAPLAFTDTPSSTPTLAPDLRLTEDAQILDSRGTPAASATPAPSITPVGTYTATPTITPLPTATASTDGWMDWGFFALGFSIPLLAGCGFVLYWIDHRPDLFAR